VTETSSSSPAQGRLARGLRIKNYYAAWRSACERAKLKGLLVHDMRRSAIRNFERAGVSRSAGMAMSGHETESVYRRYSIADAAALLEAAEKIVRLDARKRRREDRPAQVAREL
jgi:integrase